MNKIIFSSFIFLLITTSSFSDSLLYSNNHCVYDIEPYHSNTGLCFSDRLDSLRYCDEEITHNDFMDGYSLVDSNCVVKNDLLLTGLTQNQWDYLLAVLAHILGFTMLFLVNYLSILVSKGRS